METRLHARGHGAESKSQTAVEPSRTNRHRCRVLHESLPYIRIVSGKIIVRVVVTGGTGFVGRALVARLRARGDEIVLISRAPQAPASWNDVEREVSRADAVVHLAGEPLADRRWTSEHLARVRDSRVDTTHRIARAIEHSPRRPRVWVSASAVGIYGMQSDGPALAEDARPGSDALAQLCVDWEEATLAARSAGVRVVVARLGIVLGAGGGALPKMLAPFKFFAGGPVGDGRQVMSWIHLQDAARAMILAIDRNELSGPVNIVAPEPATMNDFARTLGRVLGRPSFLRVPDFLVRLALGSGRADMILTGQRVAPRKLLDAGFSFDFPQLGLALAEILHGRQNAATSPTTNS